MDERPDLTEWLRETATLHIASNHYEALLKEAAGTAADRIDRLEAENRALRDALRQFLSVMRFYEASSDELALQVVTSADPDTDDLTVADLRRAASVLGDGT